MNFYATVVCDFWLNRQLIIIINFEVTAYHVRLENFLYADGKRTKQKEVSVFLQKKRISGFLTV